MKEIEHIIKLDDSMSISLKIPKLMDAVAFKDMIAKINSILKTNAFELNLPVEATARPIRAIAGGSSFYTDEEKAFLRTARQQGNSANDLSKILFQKFGKQIKKTTMIYHIRKNFEINGGLTVASKGLCTEDQKAFILKEAWINHLTANQIKEKIKAMWNLNLTRMQVYNIAHNNKYQNSKLYQDVMRGG